MKQKIMKILKSKKNRDFFLLILLLVAAGRIWIQHSYIINNFGRIENLTVKTDEFATQEPPKRAVEKSKKTDVAIDQNSVSCNFTYLNPGENVSKLDSEQLSETSRNPVIRIYNKVAELCQLQRELNGLPLLPATLARPISMQLQYSASVSEESALQTIENGIDGNLARVRKLLADNPAKTELALAQF